MYPSGSGRKVLAEAKSSPPSFPPVLSSVLWSLTNVPHSCCTTCTSIPSFLREFCTTSVVATNSGYWGEHLISILNPPLGYPASARSFLAPSTSGLLKGKSFGSRYQSPYPVGTGPEGTPAP